MNSKDVKKITVLQEKLQKAIEKRIGAQTRVEAHMLVVFGTRETLSRLESIHQKLIHELQKTHSTVGIVNSNLTKTIQESQKKASQILTSSSTVKRTRKNEKNTKTK